METVATRKQCFSFGNLLLFCHNVHAFLVAMSAEFQFCHFVHASDSRSVCCGHRQPQKKSPQAVEACAKTFTKRGEATDIFHQCACHGKGRIIHALGQIWFCPRLLSQGWWISTSAFTNRCRQRVDGHLCRTHLTVLVSSAFDIFFCFLSKFDSWCRSKKNQMGHKMPKLGMVCNGRCVHGKCMSRCRKDSGRSNNPVHQTITTSSKLTCCNNN